MLGCSPDNELVMERIVLDRPHPVRVPLQRLHRGTEVARIPQLDLPVVSSGEQGLGFIRVEIHVPDTHRHTDITTDIDRYIHRYIHTQGHRYRHRYTETDTQI